MTETLDNEDVKRIHSDGAISLLNDFRLALIRVPCDVAFKVKRNPHNVKLEQHATKHLHSTVLIARSKWFKRAYRAFVDTDNVAGFEERNEQFKEINVRVTASVAENGQLTLQIDGITLDSFQEFINFLYSAQAKLSDDNADYLLKLSEVFKIRSLQTLVEEYYRQGLEKNPEIKTALKYLKFSDRVQMENLKKDCYTVLRKHKDVLIYTAAWNEILDRNPALLLNVFNDGEQ